MTTILETRMEENLQGSSLGQILSDALKAQTCHGPIFLLAPQYRGHKEVIFKKKLYIMTN